MSQAAQPKAAPANRFGAIQMAKGFSTCDATVTSGSITGEGVYRASTGVHGEIDALEEYLSQGGTLKAIKKISISSPPCKYCHIILTDLGVIGKVEYPGEGFGSCQGGSYGWFSSEGYVSKAAQKISGKNQNKYIDSVIERQREL